MIDKLYAAVRALGELQGCGVPDIEQRASLAICQILAGAVISRDRH